MRPRIFAVLFVGLGFGACQEPAMPSAEADVLVLEVGGDRSSLRAALVAAGVAVEPARAIRPAMAPPAAPATPVAEGGPAEAAAKKLPDAATPEPVPGPQSGQPAFFVVQLARGQTLIHLAREHLGNGNRYRELLAFNGWSEGDARRLKDGQDVKIPKQISPKTGAAGGR